MKFGVFKPKETIYLLDNVSLFLASTILAFQQPLSKTIKRPLYTSYSSIKQEGFSSSWQSIEIGHDARRNAQTPDKHYDGQIKSDKTKQG